MIRLSTLASSLLLLAHTAFAAPATKPYLTISAQSPIAIGTDGALNAVGGFDFNNDGRQDLVTIGFGPSGTSQVRVNFGDGSGGFTDGATATVTASVSEREDNLAVGYLYPPIAQGGKAPSVAAIFGGALKLYSTSPAVPTTLQPETSPIFPAGVELRSVALADLDGDTFDDIVVTAREALANPPGGERGRVFVVLNSPAGFSAPVELSLPGAEAGKLAVGDVNGDGKKDIVVCNSADAYGKIYLATGDGIYANAPVTIDTAGGSHTETRPKAVVIGNVLPGGAAEMVFWNTTFDTGDTNRRIEFTIIKHTGGGIFEKDAGLGFSQFPASGDRVGDIALGDFNGDGQLDIVGTDPVQQTGGLVVIPMAIFNGGWDLATSPMYELKTSQTPDNIAVGNVDGDFFLNGAPRLEVCVTHLGDTQHRERTVDVFLNFPGPDPAVVQAINNQLVAFAGQKAVATPTIVTAKQDDLVYAVFVLAQKPEYATGVGTAKLLKAALSPVGSKVRADKDKIAPRLVAAALLGSRLTSNEDIAVMVRAAATANSYNIKLGLTTAGKAAAVAAAFPYGSSAVPSLGKVLAPVARDLSASAPGASANLRLQTFTIAVLKSSGAAAGPGVREIGDYMDVTLGYHTGPDRAFAANVAAALMPINALVAGGEVIGGLVAQMSDTDLMTETKLAIGDRRLAKAVGQIVAAAADHFDGDLVDLTKKLLKGNSTVTKRATVLSGVLQSAAADQVDALLNASIFGGPFLTKSQLAPYAGTAAVGNGDLAGELVVAIMNSTTEIDDTARLAIVKAATKSIAVSSPSSAREIARKFLAAVAVLPMPTTITPTSTAQTLALAAPTNFVVTGAAVAGVASRLNPLTEQTAAALGAAAVAKAPKSGVGIAAGIAAELPVGADLRVFAVEFAKLSTVDAGNIAAGVAQTAVQRATISGGQITAGQSAGDIAVAVTMAGTSGLFQPRAGTIATLVASVIDPEHVPDVGRKIGALYKPLAGGTKLPRITSIGALTTGLTKRIQTCPLIATPDRVDEIAELVAELTRQVLINGGTETNLIAVGTSAIKGLLLVKQIDDGAFASDLKDAVPEIAGALAQTIAIAVTENRPAGQGRVEQATAEALLGADSKLSKALRTAARDQSAKVDAAFTAVRNLLAGPDRLVPGMRTVSNAASAATPPPVSVISSNLGLYEIGSVIDPGTRFTRLP